MEETDDRYEANDLSQSYIDGVKRISGNLDEYEDEFRISDEALKNREKSWAWFFEKFSKVSDDLELNIHTLELEAEAGDLDLTKERFPVRKSKAQLQYWIDTGNHPFQTVEDAFNDTDKSFSLSESEAEDFTDSQFSPYASMAVQNKRADSDERLMDTVSSPSSVDTATYIFNNANAAKKNEKDSRTSNPGIPDNNRIIRSMNAAIPRVLLIRLEEFPKNNAAGVSIPRINTSANVATAALPGAEEKIDCKIDEGSGIKLTIEDVKDSEVTLESKESGIGSLAVEQIEESGAKGGSGSSDSSRVIIPVVKKSLVRHRRKLYTSNEDIVEINSLTVKSDRKITSARKSIHPALNTPSISGKKRRTFRPSLLVMPWARARRRNTVNLLNKSCANNRRNRNKSMPLNSKSVRESDVTCKDVTIETCASKIVDKNFKDSIPVEEDGAEPSDKLPISPRAEVDSKEKISPNNSPKLTNTSPIESSSSLSSKDVSQIINEELRQNSDSGRSEKNEIGKSNVVGIETPGRRNSGIDRGSLFKSWVDSFGKTVESRMRNIQDVKKNLYETYLHSSGETDSPLSSNLEKADKRGEDCMSDESATLLPGRKKLKNNSDASKKRGNNSLRDSDRFNPTVVLHDFLDLKKCCAKLERENNENWLRRQNRNSDSETKEDKTSPKKVTEVVSKETAVAEKLELVNKAADIKSNYFNLLEESTSIFGSENQDHDSNLPFSPDSHDTPEIKAGKLTDGKTPPAKNKDRNPWESFFILSSSEEEDIFRKLSQTSRPRTAKKKSHGEIEASNGTAKNETLDVCTEPDSTGTVRVSYKIVSSSSEEKERSQRVRKKHYRQNRRKESPEFGLTTDDGCGDRLERCKLRDEKLGKQSPGVNSSLEIKGGKQSSLETSRDSRVARSELNGETPSVRKSKSEKVRRKSDESEAVTPSGTNDALDFNEEENNRNEISGNKKTPVDRDVNYPPKPDEDISKNKSGLKKEARRSAKRIQSIENPARSSRINPKRKSRGEIRGKIRSPESEEEPEVFRVSNYKDRSRSPAKLDDENSGDKGENSTVRSTFILGLDEEWSDNDDTMIFLVKNNPGINSRDEIIRNEEKIGPSKGPAGPDNPGDNINNKNDVSSRSRRKGSRKRRMNSTIVFKTKEIWEMDSDNS